MTTARAKPRPPPATTCSNWIRPAACRCCRSIGGKITTYRRLAEEALERLSPYLRSAQSESEGWTGKAPLPGGDMDVSAVEALTRGTGAGISISPDCTCQPPCACLRHPCDKIARQRQIDGRSRPGLRRHLDGERSQVPDGDRMGRYRRRHRLAAIEARATALGRRDRSPRGMDRRPSYCR